MSSSNYGVTPAQHMPKAAEAIPELGYALSWVSGGRGLCMGDGSGHMLTGGVGGQRGSPLLSRQVRPSHRAGGNAGTDSLFQCVCVSRIPLLRPHGL